MKTLIVSCLMVMIQIHLMAVDAQRRPESLTLTLAQFADVDDQERFLFVINGVVAFRTVAGLKRHLKELPRGSTLTWSPGCDRIGGEPLLSSSDEMTAFERYCEDLGIAFVLVPSG